jgi:hypothetical protein
MQKRILLTAISLLLLFNLQAQEQTSARINAGIEVDVLPYATGGWFAAGWAGKKQWRIRVLSADVYKPDFTTRKGFANHRIKAYALVADHFFKPNWKAIWLGGGLVIWNSSIQTTAKQQTSTFTNYLINGSGGFNITLYKHLYISPWAGLSLRAGGNRKVKVDDKLYTLPLINPEASVKMGIWF